jgi:hypothetical protein
MTATEEAFMNAKAVTDYFKSVLRPYPNDLRKNEALADHDGFLRMALFRVTRADAAWAPLESIGSPPSICWISLW